MSNFEIVVREKTWKWYEKRGTFTHVGTMTKRTYFKVGYWLIRRTA